MRDPRAVFCALLVSLSWLALPFSEATAQSAETTASDEIVVHPGQTIELQSPPGASLEAAIGGGAMTEIEATVKAPETEGDSWLVAISRNAAGVPSTPLWVKVRVDATPPTLELVYEPDPTEASGRRWLPPGVEAAVVAVDPIAGVESSWIEANDDREEGTERASLDLPGTTGAVAIRAGGADRVGNDSPTLEDNLWIDANPPTGELSIEGPLVRVEDRLVTGPRIMVRDDLSDAESGLAAVERTLDDEAAQPATWGGELVAGAHRAEAVATDRVGNQRTASLDFTVDAAGPRIEWRASARRVAERDGVEYFTSPVRVEATAEDDLAGVDELAWTRGSGFVTWTGAVENTGEKLTLRAIDRVGNETRTEASWKIDLEPPRLVLVDDSGERHPPGASVRIPRGQSIRIEATDDGAGVEEVLTSWRHVGWFRIADFQSRQQITEPGRYFVVARASDRLGNEIQVRWQVRAR